MSADQPPTPSGETPPSAAGPSAAGPPAAGPSTGWGGPPPSQPPSGWQAGPPQQYGQQYGQQPGSQLNPQEERTWAMLAHLSGLIAAFLFVGFVGPLIVMLVQGNKSPFVRRHSVEALNFQLTLLLLTIAAGIVVVFTLGLAAIVIVPIGLLVAVGALILIVLAAVKANNGEEYRYPLTLRLVS
jgi:uncharacterized protein